METATKVQAVLVLALISTWVYVGISNNEPTHYCESREIKADCIRLSSTGKTCYTVDKGWRCSEGWKELPIIEFGIEKGKVDYVCGKRPSPCVKVIR